MSLNTAVGISVSLNWNGTTGDWYDLSDHNRQPIVIVPNRIEQVQRMADGSMRKFVIASKNVIDTSWTSLPSASQTISSQAGKSLGSSTFTPTVDGKMGAGFIKAFYDANVFNPVYVKVTYAKDNSTGTSHTASSTGSSQIFKTFITDFKYTINKRLTYLDYVDLSIQFTEA